MGTILLAYGQSSRRGPEEVKVETGEKKEEGGATDGTELKSSTRQPNGTADEAANGTANGAAPNGEAADVAEVDVVVEAGP